MKGKGNSKFHLKVFTKLYWQPNKANEFWYHQLRLYHWAIFLTIKVSFHDSKCFVHAVYIFENWECPDVSLPAHYNNSKLDLSLEPQECLNCLQIWNRKLIKSCDSKGRVLPLWNNMVEIKLVFHWHSQILLYSGHAAIILLPSFQTPILHAK